MPALHKQSENAYVYQCPGCGCGHIVHVQPAKNPITGASWSWNGDMDSPTFTPSIQVRGCHCFIRNGQIEFLTDCTHELAGKTVPIPDWNA